MLERGVNMRKIRVVARFFILVGCLAFTACGPEGKGTETEQTPTIEENVTVNITDDVIEDDKIKEVKAPSKEEVLAMRATVLEGMSEEEIDRLTENIKVANQCMESAYLYDNLFDKLSDEDSLYWNYFDQKGDIQIGWAYDGSFSDMKIVMESEDLSQDEFYEKYGEPVMVYNRFDATNFIELIQDMQKSVHNELLIADLQQLIDLTSLAAETHEMEYANEIYKILHDLDYFLLRYGITDVGQYVQDRSVISKYYGVLNVYDESQF